MSSMNRSDTDIENLFAEAIALPSGTSRDEWIATRCADNPELRREVESLLRAHDEAGDFLEQVDGAPKRSAEPAAISHQGPGVMNAAAHAEAFLRNARPGDALEAYIAGLPESVRSEAQERIQAGLRVRKLPSLADRPAADQKEIAVHLPGYRIERKLGQGSLGIVYATHDEKLNRRVAIKVLQRHPDQHVRRRVLEKARKAAALNDPSVVTIFSVLDETLPPAIVMEMVEGYPLDRFAAQLNFHQKAHLLREVARGLASAHDRGLIHCDLKPDNIIVGPDMRPRILDFGIALSLEEGNREGRAFEGTPLYASPEQVRGRPLTAASDVFSFGSLMFKVLTGRAPFGGETVGQVLEAIATTAPPFLREVAVGVPEDQQAICLACLAWDPADRPTASEIALELGRFLVGEPVRLKPKLYDDLLRRSISEYSGQVQTWESQSIISREERDALETVHRRLLADEDHWIIDARRITLLQTILSGATWLAVVATVLTVWMLRDELGPYWRWALPTYFTATLFAAGIAARRERDNFDLATLPAGVALVIAPCTLAMLAELRIFSMPVENVKQLFPGTFTNQQVFAAAMTALVVSVFSLGRLKMTGFAWTTATLAAAGYLSLLFQFN